MNSYSHFSSAWIITIISLVIANCDRALGGDTSSPPNLPESSNISVLPGVTTVIQDGITAELFYSEDSGSSIAEIKITIPKGDGEYDIKGVWDEQEISFFPLNSAGPKLAYGAIFGIPFGTLSGTYPINIKISGGNASKRSLDLPLKIVSVDKDDEDVEILNLGEEVVWPNHPKTVENIVSQESEVDNIYKAITPIRHWSGPFHQPVLKGTVSSPFGKYRIYSSHIQRRIHWGIDFRVPVGAFVKASGSGTVVLAKDLFFSGKTIMIDHGKGLVTTYAHLSQIHVKPGDQVKAGKKIGNSGKSGKNTGPLLHWQATLNQVKINPMDLLDLKSKDF